MPRKVDPSKCVGCGSCVSVCPVQAIELKEQEDGSKKAVINPELCIDCGACEVECPVQAIASTE